MKAVNILVNWIKTIVLATYIGGGIFLSIRGLSDFVSSLMNGTMTQQALVDAVMSMLPGSLWLMIIAAFLSMPAFVAVQVGNVFIKKSVGELVSQKKNVFILYLICTILSIGAPMFIDDGAVLSTVFAWYGFVGTIIWYRSCFIQA